jgi:hypothetical protein
MMKKKSTVKRTRPTKLTLPPRMAHHRAVKAMEPFIDEVQEAVDEQVTEDFGLKPVSRADAARVRKEMTTLIGRPDRKKKKKGKRR